MSMKHRTFIPGAIIGLAMILGVLLLPTSSYAGGAVILVPEEDRDVPEGSQIPEHRVKQIEKKVGDYKKKMKAQARKQQQERAPQAELPKPKESSP